MTLLGLHAFDLEFLDILKPKEKRNISTSHFSDNRYIFESISANQEAESTYIQIPFGCRDYDAVKKHVKRSAQKMIVRKITYQSKTFNVTYTLNAIKHILKSIYCHECD